MAQFTLKSAILGMGFDDVGNRQAVSIPTGALILCVDPFPEKAVLNPVEMVNVAWQGRIIAVFLIDLQERGIRIDEDPPVRSRSAGP